MANETGIERALRLMGITEGPLEQLHKQQEKMDRLMQPDSAAIRLTRDLENNSIQRIMKLQLEQSVLMDVAQKAIAMAKPAIFGREGAVNRSAEETFRLMDQAVLPLQSSFAEMAERMARQTAPFEAAMAKHREWETMLGQQMKAVQLPWVSKDYAALSFEGFAVVSRLNEVIRYGEPFGDPTREIIDDDLGYPIIIDDDAEPDDRDEAHIEAGMNPSMLAISPEGIGDVLIQTGFVLRAEYAPLPATTDGSMPGHVFHPGHGALITCVEQNLRAVIQSKMMDTYGADWMKKRVHKDIANGWKQRRVEAIAHGEAELDFIQYSNFMELKDIVVAKQHWSSIFKEIFKKKEHFATSMERLHPIRLPLAHSRPIGIGQQYHLISEAGLILRALNIDIFST